MILGGLVLWICLTFGMTYLASRAEILEPLRLRVVAWKPWTALLLSCRACVGFWTGQAAAAATMGILCGLGTDLPWHSWLYLPPASGVAAVGVIDLIAFAKHGGTDAA